MKNRNSEFMSRPAWEAVDRSVRQTIKIVEGVDETLGRYMLSVWNQTCVMFAEELRDVGYVRQQAERIFADAAATLVSDRMKVIEGIDVQMEAFAAVLEAGQEPREDE